MQRKTKALELEVTKLMAAWKDHRVASVDKHFAEAEVLLKFADVCRDAVAVIGDKSDIQGIDDGRRYILLNGYAVGSDGLYAIGLDGNTGKQVAILVSLPTDIAEYNAKPYLAAQELARKVIKGRYGREEAIEKAYARIEKMKALSGIISNLT